MRPSHESLLERLSYDPETGEFRWRKNGKIAGCLDGDGYRVISIKGRLYKAGPLAWLYVTGAWPDRIVDHVDLDRANDLWANLRLATRSQNSANRRKSTTNTSGFKGVTYNRGKQKFVAQIMVRGYRLYLGAFDVAAEAGRAYETACRELHGKHGRVR